MGGPPLIAGPTMSNRTRLALANSEDFASALSPAESAVLATVLATLSLATVVGNALVMLSFLLDRSLRTHTNSFLLSLAASDMLIGALSMPFYSQYLLKGEWTLGRVLCDLWLGQDYMCSTASCLNLLVISLDRYFSVTRPLRYRAKRTGRHVALMIGVVWITSFLMWPPWIWAWQYIDGRRTVPDDDCYVQFLETNFYLTMVTSVLDYYLPLTFMLLLYYGIWRETRKRERYLAGMEAERHCQLAEHSRSSPKTSRVVSKSALGFLGMDRGRTKVSSAASIGGIVDPSWSAGVSSDPALVPLRLDASDKKDFTHNESYSSMKDNSIRDFDETACSRPKDIPLVDVSSRQGTNSSHDDPALAPLCLNANDNKDFTRVESYSSAKDKMLARNLDENASSRNKEVPLVDIPSSRGIAKHSKKHPGAPRGDKKAARVLTAILLAFIVTTTPYNVIVIIKNLDSTRSLVPDTVWYFFYFLFYVNSTLNPVCYALANHNFKRTYWRILTCSWSRQGARKASYGLSSDSRSFQQNRSNTTPL